MRIAILSPVWFAVPPSGYGGIEWIVSLLADAARIRASLDRSSLWAGLFDLRENLLGRTLEDLRALAA